MKQGTSAVGAEIQNSLASSTLVMDVLAQVEKGEGEGEYWDASVSTGVDYCNPYVMPGAPLGDFQWDALDRIVITWPDPVTEVDLRGKHPPQDESAVDPTTRFNTMVKVHADRAGLSKYGPSQSNPGVVCPPCYVSLVTIENGPPSASASGMSPFWEMKMQGHDESQKGSTAGRTQHKTHVYEGSPVSVASRPRTVKHRQWGTPTGSDDAQLRHSVDLVDHLDPVDLDAALPRLQNGLLRHIQENNQGQQKYDR
ncbi:hypothetical protein N7539_007235 [Penicillium diatomitis]|uniref:Uncharacterized protein n=1 Tax=Penicillium diatomitis TaxID=2819901 RepID=A0A9W9WVL6_9EURO|nr:uncharacterized protein N7539_007235 [Penicillium diatomitis]KAJ5477091.1 hypothetical protein N7539_007235 [Penicillium diatomitis]